MKGKEPATVCPLREYASPTTEKLKIDRDKGVIYGVSVLGERSANGPPDNNEYPAATRTKAASLLEGARVNVDHAPRGNPERSYRDKLGCLRNLADDGTRLRGDYHFPPKHPLAEQLFWDAENDPGNLGFSISTNGRYHVEAGRKIIDEILFNKRRDSIDLVSSPATTTGLFESLREPPMKPTIKQLIESLATKRPGYVKALREMTEAGIMSPEAAYDDPGETPAATESADHEVALKAGFRGAIMAVLDDESLDMKGKLSKIKEIMKAEEKLLGGGETKDTPAAPAASDTAASESLKAKVALLETQSMLRTFADEASVKLPKSLLSTVKPGLSEAECKALVEELKTTTTVSQTPRSASAWAGAAAADQKLRESHTDTPPVDIWTEERTAKRLAELRAMR